MRLAKLLFTALLQTTYLLSEVLNGSTASHISHHCSSPFFGQPSVPDCTDLIESVFPTPDPRSRFFDTEELRADPDNGNWPGTHDLPLTEVTQLPKHFAKRNCNIAVFPYHEPESGRGYGNVLGSWEGLRLGAEKLMSDCVTRAENGKGGGEYYVFSPTQRIPVLTLFIWATGAREFEYRLNQYESDPHTILQIGSHWFWATARDANSTATVAGNATLTQGDAAAALEANYTIDALGVDMIDWTTGRGNATRTAMKGNGVKEDVALNVTSNTTSAGELVSHPIGGRLPGGSDGSGGVVTAY